VAEIGANIGAHTVHLAQLVGSAGRVLAFEPQRVVFQILCANIALNEAFNVHAYHAASGSASGMLKVPYINYGFNDSNFGGVSLIDVAEGEDVRVIPLDTLPLPALRLLKIDVEGMEGAVILGARNQIMRHRPILYVENDRPGQSAELISLIEGLSYDLYWHFAYLFNQDNHAGVAENVFGNLASINLLCMPKEQPHDIVGFRKVTSPDDWWENPPAA
jgi:FkbM family methyltransferase